VSVRYEMQLNEDIWIMNSSMLNVLNQPLSQTFKKQEGITVHSLHTDKVPEHSRGS
jgi:hypothetical protein